MKRFLCLATRHTPLASVALALLLSACSTTPKVRTEAKAGADFSRFKTFALLPLPTTVPISDPGLMLRVAEPARHAVVDALTAKGLTQADPAQADLAVNLRGQSLPKVEVSNLGYQTVPVYGRRGRYYGSVGSQSVDVRNYEERTLTIEIFDHRTKELAWVGWSKREATRPVEVEELQTVIRAILAKFPPAPPKPSTAQ
jgi:hypothetical protein